METNVVLAANAVVSSLLCYGKLCSQCSTDLVGVLTETNAVVVKDQVGMPEGKDVGTQEPSLRQLRQTLRP